MDVKSAYNWKCISIREKKKERIISLGLVCKPLLNANYCDLQSSWRSSVGRLGTVSSERLTLPEWCPDAAAASGGPRTGRCLSSVQTSSHTCPTWWPGLWPGCCRRTLSEEQAVFSEKRLRVGSRHHGAETKGGEIKSFKLSQWTFLTFTSSGFAKGWNVKLTGPTFRRCHPAALGSCCSPCNLSVMSERELMALRG